MDDPKEMRIERLKQLRRVIEAAPDDRLRMRSFCEEAACGTAYCAAGWAAVDPWFRVNTGIGLIFSVDEKGYVVPRRFGAFADLARLFGIEDDDSNNLFAWGIDEDIGPHAVTKREVLDNIDRLIAGEPAELYAAVVASSEYDEEEGDDDSP